MVVSGFWPVLGCGLFGGLAVEVLRWWKIRTSPNLPQYAHSPFYWMITALMIVFGGVLAVLYGIDSRNALMVANIGASAPVLLSALIKAPEGGGEGDGASPVTPERVMRSGESRPEPTAAAMRKQSTTSFRRFLSMSI